MKFVIIPLAALIITQCCKVAIDFIKHKRTRFKLKYLNYYGGMPSSHSALFAALLIVSWLEQGWQSFEFALSLILYLVVVRDAVGIRWHLGQHGAILKQLIEEHDRDHQYLNHDQIRHGQIVTRLGHTPLEAAVGTLFGIVIAVVLSGVL
ncbi:MAG: divergent PAP2 family protein [Candidatus Kerfeldbacteria bacterium]|nr:divergent PAP2 family protein [Candidatus Kerfeldbacteria bacterium]